MLLEHLEHCLFQIIPSCTGCSMTNKYTVSTEYIKNVNTISRKWCTQQDATHCVHLLILHTPYTHCLTMAYIVPRHNFACQTIFILFGSHYNKISGYWLVSLSFSAACLGYTFFSLCLEMPVFTLLHFNRWRFLIRTVSSQPNVSTM